MKDRDALGRAIHQAKRVGGPWPAPCARWDAGQAIPVEYDYNSGEYECECSAMAAHLLNLIEEQKAP